MNASRKALALFFIGSGVNHFVIPDTYKQIVPPGLGDPARLVRVSGVAEIAGGVGVLVPRTRRLAGFGLIALLAAVFPGEPLHGAQPGEVQEDPRLGAVRAAAACSRWRCGGRGGRQSRREPRF